MHLTDLLDITDVRLELARKFVNGGYNEKHALDKEVAKGKEQTVRQGHVKERSEKVAKLNANSATLCISLYVSISRPIDDRTSNALSKVNKYFPIKLF